MSNIITKSQLKKLQDLRGQIKRTDNITERATLNSIMSGILLSNVDVIIDLLEAEFLRGEARAVIGGKAIKLGVPSEADTSDK